jgi:hypothetical protein
MEIEIDNFRKGRLENTIRINLLQTRDLKKLTRKLNQIELMAIILCNP